MTYNTIPIPQFPFSDVPEDEAENIVQTYFQATYSLGFNAHMVKEQVQNVIINQGSKDDTIIFLSYLINKLTEHLVTLPLPTSEMQKSIRERDTLPTYRTILHFLYRLIEREGINIPTDLFDEKTYLKSQNLIVAIDTALENLKAENPDKVEALSNVQDAIKKSNKFLGMGKEEWFKMVIGTLVTSMIKDGLISHFPIIWTICQHLFSKLLLA